MKESFLFFMKDNPDKKVFYENHWKRFSNNNMQSFKIIYTDFYPVMLNLSMFYLNKNESENVVQDTFLYILQHRSSLSNVKNVRAYLLTSLRHNITRYAKRKKIILKELPINLTEIKNENNFSDIIYFLLRRLSDRERQIIKLKYFQDLKNKEIAEKLNLSYQTVRNTLHNAIKKMRLYFLEINLN